jgi:restriction modification system DNA specificity domain protein
LKKVVVADESGFCSTEIIPFNGFGKINPQYLMFCMTSPFMLSSVNQLTYGMDMPRLGTNDAKNLLIPLPPLAEQQAIVEKLSALLAEIDALENA